MHCKPVDGDRPLALLEMVVKVGSAARFIKYDWLTEIYFCYVSLLDIQDVIGLAYFACDICAAKGQRHPVVTGVYVLAADVTRPHVMPSLYSITIRGVGLLQINNRLSVAFLS